LSPAQSLLADISLKRRMRPWEAIKSSNEVETTFLTHMTVLRRAAFQAVREPQGAGRRDLANVQFHHRMNFPCSVAGKMASPVRLILGRKANVPVRLSRYSDDRRSDQFQFPVRASVKRKSRCRPTENRFADRTTLLFFRYFTDNNARFVSGRILKRNV